MRLLKEFKMSNQTTTAIAPHIIKVKPVKAPVKMASTTRPAKGTGCRPTDEV